MIDEDKPPYAVTKVIAWIQDEPKAEPEKSEEQRQEDASHAIFFDEAAMHADHWYSMAAIDPLQAAMLFCYCNPNEITEDVFLRSETHQKGGPSITRSSERHKEMLQQLTALQVFDPTPRTLRQWWQVVQDRQIKHHPWIEGYMNAVTHEAVSKPLGWPVVAEALATIPSPALLMGVGASGGVEPGKAGPLPVAALGDEKQSIERIRYEVLASRSELIEAFGCYGVELKIFKALKDRPGLLAACRVKGKGQKGSRAEPMFCPFEVINWLVKTGIKEKPRLENFMGWHILETKFPSVYAEKSIGDPRQN